MAGLKQRKQVGVALCHDSTYSSMQWLEIKRQITAT